MEQGCVYDMLPSSHINSGLKRHPSNLLSGINLRHSHRLDLYAAVASNVPIGSTNAKDSRSWIGQRSKPDSGTRRGIQLVQA